MTARRPRLMLAAVVLSAVALLAACGSDDAADDDAVPACDGREATVCIDQIESLDSDAVVDLERAVELDAESSVELEAGACTAGGDGPDELTWSLCQVTLDDGLQVVLGRSSERGTVVRADVAGEAIEFPLATAPGAATVLHARTQTFVIVDADGDEIGTAHEA